MLLALLAGQASPRAQDGLGVGLLGDLRNVKSTISAASIGATGDRASDASAPPVELQHRAALEAVAAPPADRMVTPLSRWQTILLFGMAVGHAGLAIALVCCIARANGRAAAARRAEASAREAESRARIAEATATRRAAILAAASHDLRQPLHAISLFADALMRRAAAADQAEIAGSIVRAGHSMTRMFDALLDLAKVEAGARAPEVAVVPLAPLIRQLAEEARTELRGRPVEFRAVEPRALAVSSDPTLLEIMLRNLVANAVRYTRRGRILLGSRPRDGAVEIQIWDTGVGIPAADMSRIFDAHLQLSHPEGSRGAGLGLSIVRAIADRLDCQVIVRSREGRGSCFAVRVPRASGPVAQSPVGAPPIVAPADAPQVFVLESDPVVEGATVLALRDSGFRVTQVESTFELRRALVETRGIGVLGLDLRGPDDPIDLLAGWELEVGRVLPAVVIATGGLASRSTESQVPARAWIVKPCVRNDLAAAVLSEWTRSRTPPGS